MVLEAVDRLSAADQLRLWERLTDALQPGEDRGAERRARIAERAEALGAIDRVCRHLGLPAGERLQARRFTEVCRELDDSWNASRVIRAWGRWRTAIDVHLGAKPRDGVGQEAVALTAGFQRRGRRDPSESLRAWLQSTPAEHGMHAYDGWVAEQNAAMPADELPHLGSAGVANALNTTFATAVRRAQRDLTGGVAARAPVRGEVKHLDVDGRRLVSRSGVAETLGIAYASLRSALRDPDFPSPVARVATTDLWLADDIDAYRAGKPARGHRGMLDDRILGAGDVAEALGIAKQTLSVGIQRRTASFPQPDGYLGRSPWWDARKFERWRRRHRLEADRDGG